MRWCTIWTSCWALKPQGLASFAQTADLLKIFGGLVPQVERVRWISENMVAFAVPGRCDPGASHWKSQRDRTPSLSGFEEISSKDTRAMFLVLRYLFVTLDGYLFDTRAAYSEVKMFISRKSGREGHSADALADALYPIVLEMGSRRCSEAHLDSVGRKFSVVLTGWAERNLTAVLSQLIAVMEMRAFWMYWAPSVWHLC